MTNGLGWIPSSFYLIRVWSKSPLSQESPINAVSTTQIQSLTYSAQVPQSSASSQKPSVVFQGHLCIASLRFTVGIFTHTLNMVEKYQVVARL